MELLLPLFRRWEVKQWWNGLALRCTRPLASCFPWWLLLLVPSFTLTTETPSFKLDFLHSFPRVCTLCVLGLLFCYLSIPHWLQYCHSGWSNKLWSDGIDEIQHSGGGHFRENGKKLNGNKDI